VTGVLVAGVPVLTDVARSLREGFFMFWEVLWPLRSAECVPDAVSLVVTPEDPPAPKGRLGVTRSSRLMLDRLEPGCRTPCDDGLDVDRSVESLSVIVWRPGNWVSTLSNRGQQ
jgi:hypothetical protein